MLEMKLILAFVAVADVLDSIDNTYTHSYLRSYKAIHAWLFWQSHTKKIIKSVEQGGEEEDKEIEKLKIISARKDIKYVILFQSLIKFRYLFFFPRCSFLL